MCREVYVVVGRGKGVEGRGMLGWRGVCCGRVVVCGGGRGWEWGWSV